MAKNTILAPQNGPIVVALPVAAGVEAGDIALIGDAGLTGYALTDRYVAADYGPTNDENPPQGLANGEASVQIAGIFRTVNLTVTGTPDVGDKVYRVTADGTFSTTATSNVFIGYWLGAKHGVGLANPGA